MEHLSYLFKLAVRQLWRSPGYSFTVLITLALAIGANTAIFSIVNALLLQDLPYIHPDRIGAIYARTVGSESSDGKRNLDGEQWELLRDRVPSVIAGLSGLRPSGVNLQYGSRFQYLHAGKVSAHYFEVLVLHPLLGRSFSEDEDRPHGPKAVILSYSLWRSSFDGDANVLGQRVLLKGEPYTVIGVLPDHATTPMNADLYIALQGNREGEGRATNFSALLRLRDGATWQEANAEINRAFSQSERVQRRIKNGAQVSYYCVALQKAQTETLGPQSLGLMIAAGFILLIACANLAGLTLVRLLRRTGEISTRLALGASPWQIQKQLWSECLPLALAGGATGIAVGFAALRGLLLLLPEHYLPVAVHLDGRVLGFTLSLAVGTSMLFGMLPALSTRKIDLRSSIASRNVVASGGVCLRQLLITGEVALTVVLLAAAGLLVRTLVHLETLPPGFNPRGIITAKASLDDVRYQEPAAFRKLLNESLASMRTIPGVENAAVGLAVPYERSVISGVTVPQGGNAPSEASTYELYVTPGYFATLEIPVIGGRAFTDGDGPNSLPVAIINQTFARKFFHGLNPVGRYMMRDNQNLLIVGIVTDTVGSNAGRLGQDTAPLAAVETIYTPAAQIDDGRLLSTVHTWFQPSWIVRTARPVEGLTGQMQRALASAAPNLPFSGFYSMNDLMAATLATQRIEVALLAAMAGLALILSAVGIFALVANLVVQKRREIGIRIALGSTVQRAMVQIGKPGLLATAGGLCLGLVIAAATLRTMRSLLFGLDVYDAPTIVLVVVTLSVVTILAITLPALRVATIDPAKTLRED
ncbi:MAG TPA: ADOP family duplicated permease [Candidatus Angelobacter sp.]|nr:ADOP family duplicated permease [Candidatus Angelobacter sp.]